MSSNSTGLRRRKGGGTPAAAADEDGSLNGRDGVGGGGSLASSQDDGDVHAAAAEAAAAMIPSEILDQSFRSAMKAAAAVWVIMTMSCLALCKPSAFRPQETDGASLALGAASLVMGVSVVTRGLSLFFAEPFGKKSRGNDDDFGSEQAGNMTVVGSRISGAALVGFFVQAVSSITNGTMAMFPTPMLVDPVTGMDVYLLRWCEWAPLSFLMAYLTASMDADRATGGMKAALQFGLCQGISTVCGIFFPVIANHVVWWTVMIVSCALHSTLYPLLSFKLSRARSLLEEPSPCTAPEMERHERIRAAAHLVRLITVAWAALVLFYFFAWLFRVSGTANALMECSVEVLSKHLYLNFLLDAHHRIFDPSKKAERSLAEIGHMLSQVNERRSSYTLSSDEEDYDSSDDDTTSSGDESTGQVSPNGDAKAKVAPQQGGAASGEDKAQILDQYAKAKKIPGVVEMPESKDPRRT